MVQNIYGSDISYVGDDYVKSKWSRLYMDINQEVLFSHLWYLSSRVSENPTTSKINPCFIYADHINIGNTFPFVLHCLYVMSALLLFCDLCVIHFLSGTKHNNIYQETNKHANTLEYTILIPCMIKQGAVRKNNIYKWKMTYWNIPIFFVN